MELNKIFKQEADYRPTDTQDIDEVYMSEEKFIEVVNAILLENLTLRNHSKDLYKN